MGLLQVPVRRTINYLAEKLEKTTYNQGSRRHPETHKLIFSIFLVNFRPHKPVPEQYLVLFYLFLTVNGSQGFPNTQTKEPLHY